MCRYTRKDKQLEEKLMSQKINVFIVLVDITTLPFIRVALNCTFPSNE